MEKRLGFVEIGGHVVYGAAPTDFGGENNSRSDHFLNVLIRPVPIHVVQALVIGVREALGVGEEDPLLWD